MRPYPDSSFLVSRYVSDANTSAVRRYLSHNSAPLIFTALHDLEVKNALQLYVFRKSLTIANVTVALGILEADLRNSRLIKQPVNWPLAYRVSSQLSKKHSSTFGTRSLDVLHLAVAKALRAEEFVSFDERQRKAASAMGFKVTP